MSKIMTKNEMIAREFFTFCVKLGWFYEVRGDILTITKKFTPGDNEGFIECDMEYNDILSIVPNRCGSIWGTDGGGMGAFSAIKSGVFTMNKSGCNKFVLNWLKKIQG
jgi:hypothetical protein